MGVSYDPAAYGDHIAAVYDQWTSEMDPSEAVAFLSSLVPGGGRVLELGIGTGRVALPLATRGLEVVGIDASRAMVERLRQKPGGQALEVHVGDFADVEVEGVFALVAAVYSTFFSLPVQGEQLRCLCNIAAHLEPGGHLVLEAFVPDLGRFARHQSVSFRQVLDEGVWLDVARHDPVAQRIEAEHVILGPKGTTVYPAHLRYVWPSELDALALAAGLEPVGRYGGFDRSAFTASSDHHVSVYRRPAGDDWQAVSDDRS
jgi:SAM-dependent methyltransferase